MNDDDRLTPNWPFVRKAVAIFCAAALLFLVSSFFSGCASWLGLESVFSDRAWGHH